MEKPWDADATFPGGQCSRDVLLAWLATRENYTRWHNGRGAARAALVRRIAVELQLLGLPVRSTRDVRAQIDIFETNMRKAVEWKVRYGDQILKRRVGDPSAADEVRAGIMRICPEYDKLAPGMLALLETELENSTTNTPYSFSKKKKARAATAPAASSAKANAPSTRSAPTARRSSTVNATTPPPRAPPRAPQPPSRVEDEHDGPLTTARANGAAVSATAATVSLPPRRPSPSRSRPPPPSPPALTNNHPTTRSHIPRSPADRHQHAVAENARRLSESTASSQRRQTSDMAPQVARPRSTTASAPPMAIASIMSPASPMVRAVRPRSPLPSRSRSPPAKRSRSSPRSRSRSPSPPSRMVMPANESIITQQRRYPDRQLPLPPRSASHTRMAVTNGSEPRHFSQVQPQPRPQPQSQSQPHAQPQGQRPPKPHPQSRPHSQEMRSDVAKESTIVQHRYPDERHYADSPTRMVGASEPHPIHFIEVPVRRPHDHSQSQSRPAVHSASTSPTVVAPPAPSSPPSPLPSVPLGTHYERVDPVRPQRKRERSMSDDATSDASANPALDALLHQVEVDRREYECRCQALREEKLRLDLARQHIQVTKEKALARHELRLAGVPEYEIDRAFPLG